MRGQTRLQLACGELSNWVSITERSDEDRDPEVIEIPQDEKYIY